MQDANKHYSEKAIAFCGTRGIPANYGGFETAVDEISSNFEKNGYNCDIFCRLSNSGEKPSKIGKRNLVYVKGSKSRKLDTIVSSIQTAVYLLKNRKRYKHIFWFNNANFPGILLSLLTNVPISVNTDGLEWRREKWSWPFKAYYFVSSFLISLLMKRLISDSVSIQNYYKKTFFKKTTFIPYGTPDRDLVISKSEQEEILKQYGLEKGKYFLQITRFEPDNLPLVILEGFHKSDLANKGYKMVLIGLKDDTPYTLKIKEMSQYKGINVLRAIYDLKVLTVLRENCFSYVHGNSVGGTNPALLEAMETCPRIMAIKSPFSSEVLGSHGLQFDPLKIEDYFKKILTLEDQSISMRARVQENYRWDKVSDCYMQLADGAENIKY
ncbi:DUF1972 domain-containing protein [Neobacillus drentensis]|uniref:DUF1972 domain-containing protein n=1 Tax=Neobacillus drentensis TaxID=220684 RepID=UPI002FFDDCEC